MGRLKGINMESENNSGDASEPLVVAKGGVSPKQLEYLKQLEGVVTPAYIATVKKSFPWLSGLTVSRDENTLEWVAVFERDGNKEAADLGGTTFPQFPDDFVRHVKKHLASNIDRSKMDAVLADLEEFEIK